MDAQTSARFDRRQWPEVAYTLRVQACPQCTQRLFLFVLHAKQIETVVIGPSASDNISPTSGKQFPIVTLSPVTICIVQPTSDNEYTVVLNSLLFNYGRPTKNLKDWTVSKKRGTWEYSLAKI